MPYSSKFDNEIILLIGGKKQLVKKEPIHVRKVGRLKKIYERLGFYVETSGLYFTREHWNDRNRYGEDGDHTELFIGTSKEIVREGIILNKIEKRARDKEERKTAARLLGKLYGYPDCCIKHFIKLDSHNDIFAEIIHTLKNTKGNLNFYLNKYSGYKIISHIPCSFNCEKSIEIAGFVFDNLRKDLTEEAVRVIFRFSSMHILFIPPFEKISFSGDVKGDTLSFSFFKSTFLKSHIVSLLNITNMIKFTKNKIILLNNSQLVDELAPSQWVFLNWGGKTKKLFLKY